MRSASTATSLATMPETAMHQTNTTKQVRSSKIVKLKPKARTKMETVEIGGATKHTK